MYKNLLTGEMTYTLGEAAVILNKSVQEIEMLIKGKRLGFQMSDFGPVISNRHISGYLLGETPFEQPEYRIGGAQKKPRKRYPKPRTRR